MNVTNEVQQKQRLIGAVSTPDMVPYHGMLYMSPNQTKILRYQNPDQNLPWLTYTIVWMPVREVPDMPRW